MFEFKQSDDIPSGEVTSKEDDGIYSLSKAPFFLAGRYFDTYNQDKDEYPGMGFAEYYETVFMPRLLTTKTQKVYNLNKNVSPELNNANVDAVLVTTYRGKKYVRAVECKAFSGYFHEPPFYLRSSGRQIQAIRDVSRNAAIMKYLKSKKLDNLVSAPSLLLFFSREYLRPQKSMRRNGRWVITVWCLVQSPDFMHMNALDKNKQSFQSFNLFKKRYGKYVANKLLISKK